MEKQEKVNWKLVIFPSEECKGKYDFYLKWGEYNHEYYGTGSKEHMLEVAQELKNAPIIVLEGEHITEIIGG